MFTDDDHVPAGPNELGIEASEVDASDPFHPSGYDPNRSCPTKRKELKQLEAEINTKKTPVDQQTKGCVFSLHARKNMIFWRERAQAELPEDKKGILENQMNSEGTRRAARPRSIQRNFVQVAILFSAK